MGKRSARTSSEIVILAVRGLRNCVDLDLPCEPELGWLDHVGELDGPAGEVSEVNSGSWPLYL